MLRAMVFLQDQDNNENEPYTSTTQQKVQSAKLHEIKPKQFCKINTNCPYSDPDKTQTKC
jgi:hypothetical protein